jgi:ATP-dependent DNA helicase RecG
VGTVPIGLLGEFLKDIDLSEKQNTGIKKILNQLAENGSPPPEFETNAERSYLITTIRLHEGFLSEENVTENVTERESEIISIISVNATITQAEMAVKLGVARATINRDVQALKNKGIIRRVGSDAKGYWEVIN